MSNAVLVLDSQGPNALALCRTLGKKGVPVTAGGYSGYLGGMLSKYTEGRYRHPDPLADEARFLDHLEAHLAERDYAAVFPVTDPTTTICSRNKARLERTGTAVGAEDWETHLRANDKKRLFDLAADLDVPSPETHAPETLSAVEAIDAERSYTAVIKPRRSTFTDDDGRTVTNRLSGPNYVPPDADLRARFEAVVDGRPSLEAEFPLIQAYVDGVGTMATVGLAAEGDLLTHFQHEKLRVYPPSGGVGAVRQGVREPRMLAYAERVVDALEWTGPVHVEFMKTHDGDFALLEVNGRYWGSLALTVNSGVDVPWLHYHQLTGRPMPPVSPGEYATDVRQRKTFYTDLLWLRHHLSRGRLGALVPFGRAFLSTRDEFLDARDPLPLVGLLPRTAKVLANRLRGRSPY